MTTHSKFAWPDKQYDGNIAGYEEHETDQETWLIDKGYAEWMREVDPRTIPRVTQDYRVRRRDDPSGEPIGTRVYRESQDSYSRRCDRYVQRGMKIWAKAMRGYTGQARATALQAPKHDPKALFAIIKKIHGDKSEKQVTRLVRKFIGREKVSGKKIEEFNQEWSDGVRMMRANGMDLPDKFLVNLYLISLGPKYSTLEAVVSVLPASERTLVNVMARAIDHNTESDEADNSGHALLIQQLQTQVTELKRGREAAFAASSSSSTDQNGNCSVCHKPYHTKEQCFAPGGDLSHYNSTQRHEFLQEKKRRRTERMNAQAAQKPDTANVAQEQPDQAGLIAALEEKVAEQKQKMEYAKERVGGVIDIGF